MGVKLSWDSQAGKGLDAIEIYRDVKPIDPTNPPAPIKTLAADAVAYEDTTVKNKNLYYYAIAAAKGSERAFGANQLVGYFSETGPGREVVYRGDWNAGYMDYILTGELITSADLAAKLPELVNSGVSNIAGWFKFAYKGKVLFVPSGGVFTTTWQRLYDAGMVYGDDSVGLSPAGAPGAVKQSKIVEINGLQYRVRMPKLSNIGLDKYLTLPDDSIGSEFRSTTSRLLRMTVETQNGALPRFYDAATLPQFFGQHHATAANVMYSSTTAVNTQIAKTTNLVTGVVLELIMP